MDQLLERIVRRMAEMEEGRRPVNTLDPISTPLAARRIRSIVQASHLRNRGDRSRGPRTEPLIVRTRTSFHPSAGVTEGVVLVRTTSRTRAYCVRLERRGWDWRIVELEPPGTGLLPAVTQASREGRLGGIDPNGSGGPGVDGPADPDDGQGAEVAC